MPYLGIDEQSTYFDIVCDGFIVRLLKGNQEGTGYRHATIYDTDGSTELTGLGTSCRVVSPYYYLGADITRSVNLIENLPNRVRFRLFGNLCEATGNTALTNSTSVEQYLSIYPDRIVQSTKWITSDSITLMDSSKNGLSKFVTYYYSGTNETDVYENSGSESTGGYAERNSADYIGMTSDEFIMFAIVLEKSSQSGFIQYLECVGGEGTVFGWNDLTLSAGTYTCTTILILDSENREGSALLYDSSVDRLAIGDQYKDFEVNTFPDKGDPVIDLIVPKNLEPYTSLGPNWLETFEASGYDNTWSQGELVGSGNALDEDATPHASAPASWGSKSLKATCYTTSTNAEANVQHRFTGVAKKNFIVKYDFIVDSYSGATNVYNAICSIQDTSYNNCMSNIIRYDGSNLKLLFRSYYDGSSHEYNETIVEDTLYSVEFGWSDLLKYWYWKLNGTLKNSATNITVSRNAFAVRLGPHWGGSPYFDGVIFFDNFQLIQMQTIASDGAWHYDPDENDEVKITWDRTRSRPVAVMHDFPFQYGTVASPTDILLNHLKLNDNAASATLTAEVGPNGTWKNISGGTDRNTNTGGDSVRIIGRGRNLDTQDGAGYIQMAVGSGTVHDNNFLKKGSLLLKVNPAFIYTTGTNEVMFELYYDANNRIACGYNSSGDYFSFGVFWGGTSYWLDTDPVFTSNYSLQREMVFLFSWDSDSNLHILFWDGKVPEEFNYNTGTPTASHPTAFTIGCYNDRTTPGDYVFDEVKTFSECLLPFGAFHIGNGEGLLADIDNPHSDLCFFWDCQSKGSNCAKGGSDLSSSYTPSESGTPLISTDAVIVGTYGYDVNGTNGSQIQFTVTSADIISGTKGSFIAWVNVQTLPSNQRAIVSFYVDGSNFITLVLSAANYWGVSCYFGGTSESINTSVIPTVGVWHCVKVKWDDSDKIELIVNGMSLGSNAIASSFSGVNGYLRFGDYNDGVDCYIGRVFISKDSNTPEIWTAFGKPLHMPQMKIDEVIGQVGTDYQMTRIPDGSILISDAGDVVGA